MCIGKGLQELHSAEKDRSELVGASVSEFEHYEGSWRRLKKIEGDSQLVKSH